MENVYRNDALNFFESMTEKEQQVAIRYLQKIIKKPPETKEAENTPGKLLRIKVSRRTRGKGTSEGCSSSIK